MTSQSLDPKTAILPAFVLTAPACATLTLLFTLLAQGVPGVACTVLVPLLVAFSMHALHTGPNCLYRRAFGHDAASTCHLFLLAVSRIVTRCTGLPRIEMACRLANRTIGRLLWAHGTGTTRTCSCNEAVRGWMLSLTWLAGVDTYLHDLLIRVLAGGRSQGESTAVLPAALLNWPQGESLAEAPRALAPLHRHG